MAVKLSWRLSARDHWSQLQWVSLALVGGVRSLKFGELRMLTNTKTVVSCRSLPLVIEGEKSARQVRRYRSGDKELDMTAMCDGHGLRSV